MLSTEGGTGLVIREATVCDVPRMVELERQADTAAHWREQEYSRVFAGDGLSRTALVAVEDASVRGFIIVSNVGGDWELENIVVGVDNRKRGLGTALLTQAIRVARARGAERMLLEVRTSNRAARELYVSCGFVETGRRRAYYSNPPEDAVVYCCELQAKDGPSE